MKNLTARKITRPLIESLEARIAPATVFGVTDSNGLFSFDSNDPASIGSITAITGLGAGEIVKAMDFRPATGELYAIAISGAGPFTGRLYEINTTTFTATAVGAAFSTTLITANGYGMDFNPTVDRIRVVNFSEENFRLHPDTGAIAGTDTAITGAGSIAALAYTNNYPGAASTTLYAMDFAFDDLVTIGGVNSNPTPNGGVATKVADISVTSTTIDRTALDIHTTTEGNDAFYSIQSGGVQRLYDLNLITGVATQLGTIGNGTTPVFDIAVRAVALTFPDGKSFTYTDAEGDTVTVKTTAGTLKMSQFGWLTNGDGTRRTLTQMNIAGDATFSKANLTITAKKSALGGDGRVDIGHLNASNINLGAVKIGGNIERFDGGTGDALIPAVKSFDALSFGRVAGGNDTTILNSSFFGNVPLFKIKGDINGGAILLSKAGTVIIGGSIIGGTGAGSGVFSVNNLTKSLTLGGSVIAGDSDFTGILGVGSSGTSAIVKIGGAIIGGAFNDAGKVSATAKNFTLGGSIIGGNGGSSGEVTLSVSGAVKIGGSIIGGMGQESGNLNSFTPATSITIGGSVLGGEGSQTGRFVAVGAKTVIIGGSIIGGANSISGVVEVGTVGTFLIGGGLHVGQGTSFLSGALLVETAKAITIKGSVTGQQDIPALIGVRGKTNPATAAESIALGSLTIGGSVIHAQILIGGPQNNVNAAAGKITIGGDFIASSIAAGFREGADNLFGTNDDVPVAMGTLPDIKAAIGSIIIKGRASGTQSDGDHYGIVAEHLGSVSIAGRKLNFDPVTLDNKTAGVFGDFRVRENAIP